MNPRKGLVLAMEEADAPLVQVEINAEKEMSAEIEADSAELAEDAQEIEDLNTAVESAENDIDTLESINAEMTESVEQGEGLEPKAARIAEVAIESVCLRLMGGYDGAIVPSMESFGGKSSRLTATRIAIENNENIIVRALKAIGAAISAAFNAVVEFVQKFFDANERQKKAIKSMLDAVLKTAEKDEEPKQEKFENSSLTKASIGGKGMTPGNAKAMVENAALLIDYANGYSRDLPNLFEGFEKTLKSAESDGTGEITAVEFQLAVIEKAKAAFPNVTQKSDVEWVAQSRDLVNGEFLKVTCKPAGSGQEQHSFQLTMELDKRQGEVDGDSMSETLSIDGMVTVLRSLAELCVKADSLKESSKKLGNTKKRFDQMYTQIANAVSKKEDGFVRNWLTKNDFRKQMSTTSSFTTQVFRDVPKIVNKTGKAGLFYIEQSIKQYPNLFDKIRGSAGQKIDGAKNAVSNTWDGAKDYAKNKAGAADKAVAGAAYGAKNAVGAAAAASKAYAGNKIDDAKNAASGAWGAASNKLKSAFAD